MSLKLTTSLSQRLVLTPQLRQRIEMLQMTTLELTDLIQQQMLENPVLVGCVSGRGTGAMERSLTIGGHGSVKQFDQRPARGCRPGQSLR
jgi:DNA-directed RNA polymerase specialized sigma54-like protein